MKTLSFVAAALLATTAVYAQEGDHPGEVQKSLVPKELIPPAPVLTAEQEMKTFQLDPGFHVELVASEPLVHDPIAMTFGPDGRLWVVEMRGYMPTLDGVGEKEKVADIVVLEDTDGDGKMDKRTVFLEGLVMPRAVALVGNGVLVAEPPKLWFCRDTKGTGKCDSKIEIANDYAKQDDPELGAKASPEHASNGLMWALDNWIYSANHTIRYRYVNGEFKRDNTIFRGQWGISQDNYGRIVYNSNSDQFRIDYVPSAYLSRNPFYRGAAGANVDPIKDQKTYPSRVNPGVNRGYQPQQLREGRLATFTAACGPVIYRGDNFPAEFQGNAFVCEPAGNLIKRDILKDEGNNITGREAYPDREFMTSTDERFRPVNAFNGPDGALYIVDMYRGVIQHRIFVTSYLRAQAEDRNLQSPIGLGRIYRVVHEGKKLSPVVNLGKATPAELVATLASPNGWSRDMAQRLLVESAPESAIAPLKQMARQSSNPLARIHALWTLEGMNKLDTTTLLAIAKSETDAQVRAHAIRLCETFFNGEDQIEVLPELLKLVGVQEPAVQLQLAFTLGQVKNPETEAALATIARQHGDALFVRDAVISGLATREGAFLQNILTDTAWHEQSPAREQFLSSLAKAVFTQGKRDGVTQLLKLACVANTPAWQQAALLNGMVASAPKALKGKPAPYIKLVRLAEEPVMLTTLTNSPTKNIASAATKVASLVAWPGKPGVPPEPVVKPLTPEEQQRFVQGKALFEVTCAACHQLHGFGQEGLAPPLVDSEWVAGTEKRLVRIALSGLRGPVVVKGQKFDLDMPSFGALEDDQLAAVLTYVRREWEHTFDPVAPATVKAIRAELGKRNEQWTEAELLKIR